MTCTCGHDLGRHLRGNPMRLGSCRIGCGCQEFTERKAVGVDSRGGERIQRHGFIGGGLVRPKRTDGDSGDRI